jgi:hypothetical protein
MTEDKTYSSYDLLSFDFLHDNKNQVDFFKSNKVYNLNYLLDLKQTNYLQNFNNNVKFNINGEYLKNNIPNNVEDYVKNIMFSNFVNKTEHYVNTTDIIPIKYDNKYVLILDNMQCSLNNILNVKMLLNNPTIKIYIPFIACCEKINPKCINNAEDTIKCVNIKNAYNSLRKNLIDTNELEKNNISIYGCDFYDNAGNLKQEYKDESILIGFDYINNKLLNFNDINDLPEEVLIDKTDNAEMTKKKNEKKFKNSIIINKIIAIFNEFKRFTEIIKINNILYYNNVIKKILEDIEFLEITNYVYNTKDEITKNNLQKFDNVKALIYSMKEMRDWYYVKEIVKRNKDLFDEEPIFCTVDSINLFRSIIYRISTFNLSHYNVKYTTMYVKNNNKEYIYYKQISPSYFYLNNNEISNQTKQKIYDLLNNNDTFFVKKEIQTITGGNLNYLNNDIKIKNNSLINIKIKKYSIYSSMDINKLRLELSIILKNLRNGIIGINFGSEDTIIYYNKISYIPTIIDLYKSLQKLYEFTNKYNYNDLIKIDYKYNDNNFNLSDLEIDFIKSNYKGNIEYYTRELDLFNCRFIQSYKYKLNELKTRKFYSDENYILTEQEQLSSLFLTFIIEGVINTLKRETFGYVLKTVLNEYDYNLIRNVLYVFYDELYYNDLIREKIKIMEIFDEELFYEVTKIVKNPYYDLSNDKIRTEEFEEKHESKYNEIQELIKINKLEYFNN